MKYYFGFITIIFLFAVASQSAYAHILQTSGSVGAVMHIAPDDNPVVGQPSDFFFEFKDKENEFTAEQCICIATISQNGQEVFSASLFENAADPSLTNSSFSYTFPAKDVYTIKVTGRPKSVDAFEPFTLTYDLRVEKTGTDQEQETNWLLTYIPHIVGAIIGIIIVGYLGLKQQDTERG